MFEFESEQQKKNEMITTFPVACNVLCNTLTLYPYI